MKIPLSPKTSFEKIFVNRKQELSLLQNMTDVPGSCTYVCGKGGIGKTALVNMFVHKNRDKLQNNWIRYSANKVNSGNILDKAIKLSQISGCLLILDDAENLSNDFLRKVEDIFTDSKFGSLIVASRRKPENTRSTTNVIELSNLDMRSMLETRLALLPNAPHVDQVFKIIDGNSFLFNSIMSNPKVALNIASSILGNEGIGITQNIVISYPEEEGGSSQESGSDPLGIILALVLFFISYFSNHQSTGDILSEIDSVKTVVEKQIESQANRIFKNPHLVTAYVHLRSESNVSPTNIITILAPNQIVDVDTVNEGWANVTYKDVHSGKAVKGWVSSKYIKSYQITYLTRRSRGTA